MDYKLKSEIVKSNALEQIFYNRGFSTKESIYHYLNTNDNDIIDPEKIDNMNNGVKMLIKHIANNDDALLIIDPDTDGFTSSAILLNYLNNLFPNYVENHITYWVHDNKEHGIDVKGITEKTKLILALDSSSNELELHKALAEKDIDILVIDHHNAEEISPYACIINNQLCDYPTKSLSGAGMVYKFCSYIDKLLNVNYSENYLDLAALGIIVDVMKLNDFETRHIVKKGLENIQNPFLKTMINNDERYFPKDKPISIKGIAWSIGPLVNAVTRVGTVEEKLLMFEAMLESKAYELIPSTKRGCKGQNEQLVVQAVRMCKNIKNRQDKARDRLVEEVEYIIQENNLLDYKILTIQLDKKDETTKNITGLVANKLMGKYKRPVLLLRKTINSDDSISWSGSGRNYSTMAIPSLQKFLLDTNLVEFAQGHDSAFGVSIKDEMIESFLNISQEKLKNVEFTTTHDVDYIYENFTTLATDVYSIAELKSIWGQGVEEPLMVIKKLKITPQNIQLLGAKKNTWKISLNDNLSLIKFGITEEDFNSLIEPFGCVYIDLIGTCEINDWDNSPQINVIDYEIVNRVSYDF